MTELLTVDGAAQALGLEFFEHQLAAFAHAQRMPGPAQRLCHYYPTGRGKTATTLVTMALWGQQEVLVLAPPATHPAWLAAAEKLGLEIELISHAKFRMKSFRVSRSKAVIVDEFHLLGGTGGLGWQKMERLARSLQAPLLLASATPNYNDAERVYCIQRVLDPGSCSGGYLQWLYTHCLTAQNPFGVTPNVTGFRNFDSAAAFLASLPGVLYLPDTLSYDIEDYPVKTEFPDELLTLGYNRRRHRLVASGMERKHTLAYQGLVGEDGLILPHVYDLLTYLVGQAPTPVLMYCNRATVAQALQLTMQAHGVRSAAVTGQDTSPRKQKKLDQFRAGLLDVLVGTATLATGTDGLDKVCDVLIIVDDTEDDALRRQLIGRIMPRGEGGDAEAKQVLRLVLDLP